jgi:hypothetical protein
VNPDEAGAHSARRPLSKLPSFVAALDVSPYACLEPTQKPLELSQSSEAPDFRPGTCGGKRVQVPYPKAIRFALPWPDPA